MSFTRRESRTTIAMLAPAVHIMHQVWRGMAWVADGIDEDDEATKSIDATEQASHTEMPIATHCVLGYITVTGESAKQFCEEKAIHYC